ncbi:glutamine synthetase domain protein [Burkholderia pseudomallei MSHR5613]|nr:glutamine synthetase domain protein [Burkholderia pseudomallei MSHR4378]KGS27762.1 glutamine synthetase domain protein [Burkholderia pseudomallei MSHR5569]KGS27933.1 glutamine synthetase domain protein [Burkholderia pseudomallei MSHR7343]KGS40953.1 glutamine synthetase domain protein [Burkholderia pseudomallei ABCPW 107]KGS42769.1 glutamine synthetase domain protein [Burkholderia pseudomallei MSHR5492]KGS49050.1 glutamine synthetase domain protein [Burkholderia pseudomallei MSHR5613]KGS570
MKRDSRRYELMYGAKIGISAGVYFCSPAMYA